MNRISFTTLLFFFFSTYILIANNSLHFNGGENVTFSMPSLTTNEMTVELWFHSDNQDACTAGANHNLFNLDFFSSFPVGECGGNLEVNGVAVGGPNIRDGKWHHLALVMYFNTGTYFLYLDGLFVTMMPHSMTGFNGNFRLSQGTWRGEMDELRIWKTSRTTANIFTNRECQIDPADPDLFAYYTFDEGIPNGDNTATPVLTDQSANSNNGNLVGFTLKYSRSNFVRSGSPTCLPCGSPPANGSVVDIQKVALIGNTPVDTLRNGQEFTYKVNFSVNQQLDNGLTITEQLPAHVELVGYPGFLATPTNFSLSHSYDAGTHTLTLQRTGTIPISNNVEFSFRAKYTPGLRPCDDCHNCNYIDITGIDGSNTYFHRDTLCTEIKYGPANRTKFTAACDTVRVGDTTLYKLNVISPSWPNGLAQLNMYDQSLKVNVPTGASVVRAWFQRGSGSSFATLNVVNNGGNQYEIFPPLGQEDFKLISFPFEYSYYFEVGYPSGSFSAGDQVDVNTDYCYLDNCGDSYVITNSISKILEPMATSGEVELTAQLAYSNFWTDVCCANSFSWGFSTEIAIDSLVIITQVPSGLRPYKLNFNGPSFQPKIIEATTVYNETFTQVSNSWWWSIGYPMTAQSVCADPQDTINHFQLKEIKYIFRDILPCSYIVVGYDFITNPETVPGGVPINLGDEIINCAHAEYFPDINGSSVTIPDACDTLTIATGDPVRFSDRNVVKQIVSASPYHGNPFQPGECVRFQLHMSNYGSKYLPDVDVIDYLDTCYNDIQNLRYQIVEGNFGLHPSSPNVNNWTPITLNTATSDPKMGNIKPLFDANAHTLTFELDSFPGTCRGERLYIEYDACLSFNCMPGACVENYFNIQCNDPDFIADFPTGVFPLTDSLPGKNYQKVFITDPTTVLDIEKDLTNSLYPGAWANYDITLNNNSSSTVRDIVIVDVLPDPSDLKPLTGFSRGSTGSAEIPGAISLPPGHTAEYWNIDLTGSPPNFNNSDLCDGPSWGIFSSGTSQPVNSVKIKLPTNDTIQPGGFRNFQLPMMVPIGTTPGTIICNDLVYQAKLDASGILLLPAQSATVCDTVLECTGCTIFGRVWDDADNDGQQTTGEVGFNGLVINLYEHPSNNFVASTISANNAFGTPGQYQFCGLSDTLDYYIEVVPLSGYNLTNANVGSNSTDSDIDPFTLQSAVIDLASCVADIDIGVTMGSPCECEGYSSWTVENVSTGTPASSILCGGSVMGACTDSFFVNITQNCFGTNCPAMYDWELQDIANGFNVIDFGTASTSSLGLPMYFSNYNLQAGTYRLVVSSLCGPSNCDICTLDFILDCDPCTCLPGTVEFIDAAGNIFSAACNSTITVNESNSPMTVDAFGFCNGDPSCPPVFNWIYSDNSGTQQGNLLPVTLPANADPSPNLFQFNSACGLANCPPCFVNVQVDSLIIPLPPCDSVDDKTFSVTLIPGDSVSIEFATEGIVNSKGEYVILGLRDKEISGTFANNLYFAVMDGQGNYVYAPKELKFTYTSEMEAFGNTNQHGFQLVERFDLSGNHDGYMAVANVNEPGSPTRAMLFRLDPTGNVIWTRFLQDASGVARLTKGLHYNSATDKATIVVESQDYLEVYQYTDSICTNLREYHLADANVEVSASTEVSGLPNANAAFAITGVSGITSQRVYVLLLDDNLDLASPFATYDLDGDSNTVEEPYDIKQDGDHLVIAGELPKGNGSVAFLLKILPYTASGNFTGNIAFSKELDILDTAAPGTEKDLPISLDVTANSEYAITGNTNFGNAMLSSFLIKTNSSGMPLWANTYTDVDYDHSIGFNVTTTPDDGFFLVGEKYSLGGSLGAKIWAAKTDENGRLGDCDCYEDIEVDDNGLPTDTVSYGGFFLERNCQADLPLVVEVNNSFDQIFCDQYCPPTNLPNEPWVKLAGDSLPNHYSYIERVGDFIYACGYSGTEPDLHATFSKYDLSGNLNWTVQLDEASIFNKFASVDENGTAFLVVGRTHPITVSGQWQDNQSILCRISQTGNVQFVNQYQQTGRENFINILRHENPVDPAFPFYISGVDNASTPASSFDMVFVINVNANGNAKWKKRYRATTDNEFVRQLMPLANGGLGLWGNKAGPFAYALTITGDGDPIMDFESNNSMLFRDAIEIQPSGDFYTVGQFIALGSGFIARLDANGNEIWSFRMGTQERFDKIEEGPDGNLYVLGRGIVDGTNRYLINQFTDTGNGLTYNWTKYLDDGESGYLAASFDISPDSMIAYTDCRIDNPNGIGDYDILIGNFNLSLDSVCVEDFMDTIVDSFFLVRNEETVDTSNLSLNPIPALAWTPIDYICNDFCVQPDTCQADFDFALLDSCGKVQFTDLSTTNSSFAFWIWTFDDPASGTDNGSSLQNPMHQFSASGTYNVCLSAITTNMTCNDVICKNVTVSFDDAPPVFTCPSDTIMQADQFNCNVVYEIPDLMIDTACATFIETICTRSDGLELTDTYPKDTTTITCTVTNDFGTTTCSWDVIVEDVTPPFALCLTGIVANLDANCEAFLDPSDIDVGSYDNCEIVDMYLTPNVLINCDVSPVVLNVVDCGNNVSTCTTLVTVLDPIAPIVTCPIDTTVTCIDSLPSSGIFPNAIDNCTGPQGFAYSFEDTFSGEFCDLTVEREWTVIDHCGNSGMCTYFITVRDTIAPTFIDCPADTLVSCEADIPVPNNPPVSDNCNAGVTITLTADTSGLLPCDAVITRTWIAMDTCMNADTCIQKITVIDTTSPEFTDCPANISVDCETDIPAILTPEAVDSCSSNLTITLVADTLGNLPCDAVITNEWVARDLCGNTDTCSMTITVIDNIPPVFTDCPANVGVDCETDIPAISTPVATDNCTVDPTIVLSADTSGSLPCDAVITNQWVATDSCGLTDTCAMTITVIDNIPPVFTDCPANITVIGTLDPVGVCSAFVNVPLPTVTDCSNVDLTNDYNSLVDASGDYTGGTTTVTWTATDTCMNVSMCSTTITVECEGEKCDSIQTTTMLSPIMDDSCCFLLTLDNQIANCFSGVKLTGLNGVSISTAGGLNGWGISSYGATSVSMNAPLNDVATGVYDYAKICLSNYDNMPPPQYVAIEYNDLAFEPICYDTLEFNCVQEPKCAKGIMDTTYCDANGNYNLDFCVQSHPFTGWNMASVEINTPAGIIATPSAFPIPSLTPGGTHCTLSTNISGGQPGDVVCLSLTAHEQDVTTGEPLLNCCTDTVSLFCITLPACDSCCMDEMTFIQNMENAVSSSVDNALCKATVHIDSLPPCDEIVEINWGDGAIDNGPFTAPSMQMHTYSGSGAFTINITAVEIDANGDTCFTHIIQEVIDLNCIPDEDCCRDSAIFCEIIDPVWPNYSLECDTLCFTPRPDSCIHWCFDWGDGSLEECWDVASGSPDICHIFDESPNVYNVCMTAYELDSNGDTCNIKMFCDDFEIQPCDTCCQDEMTFIQNMENAISSSVDNALCKGTVHIDSLPPCDEIVEINWGDGTIDNGPFTAPSMQMHTYSGSGAFTINITAVEIDANGDTCFTHIIQEVIDLNCMGCSASIECPSDTTVYCCGIIDLPDVVIVDSCGIDTIICTRSDGLGMDEPFPSGTTCIVCEAQENNAVVDVCEYCVTVEDTTPPVITCPADTLILMADDSCKIGLPDYTDLVTAVDPCDGFVENCIAVSASLPHSSFISFVDGSLYAWGLNQNDQLGLGITTTQNPTPILSTTINNVAAISGGKNHTTAIKTDGSLWAWGSNVLLGTGNTNNQPTPVQIGTDTDWKTTDVGPGFSFAIKTDGRLFGWGSNGNGQLGIGNFTDQPIPVHVMPNTIWESIDAETYIVGIQSNGTLWDFNDGTGIPKQIGTDNDWIQVTGTNSPSYFALKSNGTLWAWGVNNIGQLGLGTTGGSEALPVQIGTETNWVCVDAAASSYTYAVKSDGTLWAWGDASFIGNNDPFGTVYNTPQQIGTDNDWTCCMSVGADHIIISKTDGSVWSWGVNIAGATGNGTITPVLLPEQIFPPTNSGGGNGNGGGITLTQKPAPSTILSGGIHDITICAEDACGNIDSCTFQVEVVCDTTDCCRPEVEFCEIVENVLPNYETSCDTLCIRPVSDTCIHYCFDWGDGTPQECWDGISPDICHDYNLTEFDVFNVCMTAFELDNNGDTCNVKKDFLTVELEPCDTTGCTPNIQCPSDTTVFCCGPVELPEIIVIDSCGLDSIICTRSDGLPMTDPFYQGKTFITCTTIGSTTFFEEQKIFPADIVLNDQFGYSVAIDGNIAVIGSPNDNTNGQPTGSISVFEKTGDDWVEQVKLAPDDGTSGDAFGRAVDLDNECIVVGSQGDDDNGSNSGSVYIFQKIGDVWEQAGKLLADDGGANDFFGSSVAISGSHIIIGAAKEDEAGTNAGAAYIFRKNGNSWSQAEKLMASDAVVLDEFGSSVSISGDYAVVGAWKDDIGSNTNAGSAYFFHWNGTTWEEEDKVESSAPNTEGQLGVSVAIDGDYAVVGANTSNISGTFAGVAYVFQRSGTVWNEQSQLTPTNPVAQEQFGWDVAIDNDKILVGAYLNDENGTSAGAAYQFYRTGDLWLEESVLYADDASAEDEFGFAVGISGSHSLIGAKNDKVLSGGSGSAYIFKTISNNSIDSCTYCVTVIDSMPSIICPPDITIVVGESTDPTNTGEPTAEDDCYTPTVSYMDEVDVTQPCPYTITRTWSAVDSCGQKDICKQLITVECEDPCCRPVQEFNELVDVVWSTRNSDCDSLCFTISPDTCITWCVDWGDGNFDCWDGSSPDYCHDYNLTQSTVFEVCMTAFELDSNGDTCNIITFCDESVFIEACDQCECEGWTEMSFGFNTPNGFIEKPASCNNTDPILFECPFKKEKFYFHGNFNCTDTCGAAKVDWDIIETSTGNSVNSGTVTAGGFGSSYHFDINDVPFPAAGSYELVITSFCGTDTCECSILFEVPDCTPDCVCDDPPNLIPPKPFVSAFHFSGCTNMLQPNFEVDDRCDVVNWSYIDWSQIQVETPIGTTQGNDILSYNFPSSGIYTICMEVVRTQPDGTTCSEKDCQKVRIKCGLPSLTCDVPLIADPGFNAVNTGVLNNNPMTGNWFAAFGEPEVIGGAGCINENSIELTGNKVESDGLSRVVLFNGASTYALSFCQMPLQGALHPYSNVVFRISEEPLTSFDCSPDDCVEIAVQWPWKDTVNKEVLVYFNLDPPFNEGAKYLTVHVENGSDNPDFKTTVQMDGLCIEAYDVTDTEESFLGNQISLYPNPTSGNLTLEFYEPITEPLDLQLVDIVGHVIETQQLQTGHSIHQMDVTNLPPAVYFIALKNADGQTWYSKFVKQ